MPERSHLSIGEVLSLLREEFPDVTISKIRFLESQGLVDPERTPSGYRKFYDHDVDRLRWILRQQREHFLPLKVIRGRLTEQEETDEDDAETVGEAAAPEIAKHSPEGSTPGEEQTASTRPGGAVATAAHDRGAPQSDPTGGRRDNGPGRPAPPTPSLFASLHAGPDSTPGPTSPPAPTTTPTPSAEPTRPARAARLPAAPTRPAPAEAEGGYQDESESYTAEELAGATGIEASLVQELKQYGLIVPHATVAGVAYYDAGSLAIVRAAAKFSRHGVEARHLRPWRNAADREADLFQQVVLPLIRQRNPQARRQALETLDELSTAGAALRAALVERAVREIR